MELALHGSQVDFEGFLCSFFFALFGSVFANQCDHYFVCVFSRFQIAWH